MDPFTIEPPRWLQEVAKPVNGTEMGRSLAMGLSSLVTAFEDDPDAKPNASWLDSRKGLKTGMAEVSNAQIDPQWRVKGQLLANQVLEQRAQLAAQGALVEERRKETSAWMEDAPKLAPWITATPEERKGMAAPAAKSKIGMQTLQKQSLADQRYYTSQDQMANKLDQERLKAEHSAGITAKVADWNDALGSADPATFSEISAMKNGGRLPNGLPTPEAISSLNKFRTANGMTLYGTKASEYLEKPGRVSKETQVQLDDLRADESDLRRRIDAAAKNSEPTADMEEQLESIKQQRKALASGKPVEQASSSGDSSEDKKLQHQLNTAIAGGVQKDIDTATKAIQTSKKTRVLDQRGKILPQNEFESAQVIATAKPNTLVWDSVRGVAVNLTAEMIAAAQKKVADKKAHEEQKRADSTARMEAMRRATIPEWQRLHGLP